MADLIGRVRALAQDAEDGGLKRLAQRLRAAADEAEAVFRTENAGRFLHRRPGLPAGWPASVRYQGWTYWATGRWDVRPGDQAVAAEYEASDGGWLWRLADGTVSVRKP
jgi:hypothetical protein